MKYDKNREQWVQGACDRANAAAEYRLRPAVPALLPPSLPMLRAMHPSMGPAHYDLSCCMLHDTLFCAPLSFFFGRMY